MKLVDIVKVAILQIQVLFKELFIERHRDVFNISKHEILSNDRNDRTFHLDDALLCYYVTRMVEKEILLEFNCEGLIW